MRPLVLGGGFSGLAAAHAWSTTKRFPAPVLIERAQRVGGWVTSIPRHIDGASSADSKSNILFEAGPHSFRTRRHGNGRLLSELVHSLDTEKRAIPSSKSASGRYLWVNNELVKLPSSLISSMTHPLTRALTYHVVADFLGMSKREKSLQNQDETIHDFFARKFGKSFAEDVVGGIVAGVFAGDTKNLSLKACFPDLYRIETTLGNGSIVRGALRDYWMGEKSVPAQDPNLERLLSAGSVSFPNGLQELVNMLENSLEKNGTTLVKNAPIKSLHRDDDLWIVELENNQVYKSNSVASTLGIRPLLKILKKTQDDKGVSLLEDLERHIGRVNVAVVNLYYPNNRPNPGFGHLVPRTKDQVANGVLGIIYDSIAFPAQQPALSDKGCVLTLMMGGAHAPWIAKENPSKIIERAHETAQHHLAFREPYSDASCAVHLDCIPQYKVGHVEAARKAREYFVEKNLYLLGTGFGPGVGIADAVGESLRTISALR